MGALSVGFAISVFTDVFVPIGIGMGALSVLFAILPFTDVFVPIGPGIGAPTVRLSVLVVKPGALRLSKTHTRTSKKCGNRQAEGGGQFSHGVSPLEVPTRLSLSIPPRNRRLYFL